MLLQTLRCAHEIPTSFQPTHDVHLAKNPDSVTSGCEKNGFLYVAMNDGGSPHGVTFTAMITAAPPDIKHISFPIKGHEQVKAVPNKHSLTKAKALPSFREGVQPSAVCRGRLSFCPAQVSGMASHQWPLGQS